MKKTRNARYRKISTMAELRTEKEILNRHIEVSHKSISQTARKWATRGSQLLFSALAVRLFSIVSEALKSDGPQKSTYRANGSHQYKTAPASNDPHAEAPPEQPGARPGSNQNDAGREQGQSTRIDNIVDTLDRIAFTVNTIQSVAHQFQQSKSGKETEGA